MVKRSAALGLGIGIVSGLCLAESDRERLHAIEIPEEFEGTTIYGVLTRRARRPSPSLHRLLVSIDPGLVSA